MELSFPHFDSKRWIEQRGVAPNISTTDRDSGH